MDRIENNIQQRIINSNSNDLQPLEKKPIGRRSVIKKMAVGTAALAGYSALPDRWTTPLIEFGSLPAHATTSGSLESVIEELKQEIEAAESADAAATNQSVAETAEATEAIEPAELAAPVNNEVKIMNTGQKMSWDSYYYDKFVFPKLGPEYTNQSFDLYYSDGNHLHVPNPEKMTMTPDNMKYQPGGKYSGNNPDIPTMEVYARKDTHPEWVKAVFKHDI